MKTSALTISALLIGAACLHLAPAAAQGQPNLHEGKSAREIQRAARDAERQQARDEVRERRQQSQNEAKERREAARRDRVADCEHVAAFLAGTVHIPPEALARRFGGGTRGERGNLAHQLPWEAWLLQDARFQPAFGKPYDAMTPEEGKSLYDASRGGCAMPRNERGQAMSDNMLLFRAFDSRYQPSYVQAVRQIRDAHAKVKQTRQALAALPPGEAGRQTLRSQTLQRSALEGFLDENSRAAYRLAFADAYGRVVAPGNEARVAAAVAQAHGLEGLRALARLETDLQDEARAAAAEVRLPTALRERQQVLIAEIATGERARVDALGDGLVALERGAQWFADYRQRLGPLIGSSAAGRELIEHFETRRGAALQTAERELSQRIAATRSDAELQELTTRYLPLAMDQHHVTGTALFTRVTAQRDELHKRSVLGSSSPAATATGEPSEPDMYDAFNAVLQSHNATARGIAQRCNNREFQNDPVLAIQCLQYGIGVGTTGGGQRVLAPEFKVSTFQKLGCATAVGEAGWRCDYVAGFTGNIQLPPSLAALMGDGGHGQARFLRRGDGWLMLTDPAR